MKGLKITFATLALTLFANISMAQDEVKRTPDDKAKRQTERMAEKLTLTPEQKEKVGEINLSILQKNEAIRADQKLSEEAKKEAVERNNVARASMIKPLLNAEQLRKFEEMETNHNTKVETGKVSKPTNVQKAKPNTMNTNH